MSNNYPKLHNAMWPGLVGKGPDSEPPISLDEMLDLTANAEVDGNRFEGVDLFLFDPHVSIDSTEDDLKHLADRISSRGFVVGSIVAPVWPPTGGGSAMGSDEDRKKFVDQVRKACRIGQTLRDLGVRPYGIVRIDSASSPSHWAEDPDGNQQKIADTFNQACDVAEDFGERLAAEGEICWGGMHSWKKMVQLLELVGRPKVLGFQADMAHTLLYTMGYNAPEDAILPPEYDWSDPEELDRALETLTAALRPWTIDFHVAQNDATVKGSGSHDKTGRHCLATDANGKLDIPHHAGYWLRNEDGRPTKAFQHICWDGCMFPNEVMKNQQTWNDILAVMVAVRDAHGWEQNGKARSSQPAKPAPTRQPAEKISVSSKPKPKPAAKKLKKPAAKASRPAPKKKKTSRLPVKPAKAAKKTKPTKAKSKKAVKAKVKAKPTARKSSSKKSGKGGKGKRK